MMILQKKYSKDNLVHTHSMFHVIWKKCNSCDFIMEPLHIQTLFSPPSNHQGKWQGNNPGIYSKSFTQYLPLMNPFTRFFSYKNQ